VNDPSLVKKGKARSDPLDPVAPDAGGDGNVKLAGLLRRLGEVPAVDIFHREKVGAPLPAEIEYLDQVGWERVAARRASRANSSRKRGSSA